MFHRKAEKRIVELSPEEKRLMRDALLSFRTGFVGKEVINAINTSNELSSLEKMIRKVVSEELKKVTMIPFEQAVPDPETEEAENNILDFLENF